MSIKIICPSLQRLTDLQHILSPYTRVYEARLFWVLQSFSSLKSRYLMQLIFLRFWQWKVNAWVRTQCLLIKRT